jgi:hypothetical protein
MARDRERELYDFQNMTDAELREVVLEQLRDAPNIDADDIDVDVLDGHVTLSGRVGTDAEVQVVVELVDDVLGLDRYSSELVVDEVRRGGVPAAADDAITYEEEIDDQLGDPSDQQSDTAEHLMEDLDAETFGTHDMGKAIQDGNTYIPPDRPVGDGYGNREEH